MSTHDMIIADASGSAFLADLNLCVKALAENASGTTEPAVMYAHMWWADTTTDILKQRNAANIGWLSRYTLSTGALLGQGLGTPSSGVLTNCTGTAAGLTAGAANRTDSGEVTVTAHATTGDIFATAANSILWDDASGAITTTAFPASPKAGLTRDLRLNGSSKFTAGANLLIEGIVSGNTITLGAGALCHVRAITTTQFKMTYSYSGNFAIGATGLTTSPTANATFVHQNGVVNLQLDSIGGTSNSTAFTITGIPASLTSNNVTFVVQGYDAGVYCLAVATLTTGGIFTLYKSLYGGLWTASGTKLSIITNVSYKITY